MYIWVTSEKWERPQYKFINLMIMNTKKHKGVKDLEDIRANTPLSLSHAPSIPLNLYTFYKT